MRRNFAATHANHVNRQLVCTEGYVCSGRMWAVEYSTKSIAGMTYIVLRKASRSAQQIRRPLSSMPQQTGRDAARLV